MIDFGKVAPGSTLFCPFHTFDSNDPSASVTLTGLAAGDIEIYKDGSMTQRASTSGYTLLDTDGIDLDGTTGIHGFSIDLSDNTTAGFYNAGSRYFIVVASVTVDGATVNFVYGTFTIGYHGALAETTIATLASQTSFTLTAGSADNDAYNGWTAVIHDIASGVQVAAGLVGDYVGSTKTVTLNADPGIFTMAAGDNISLFPPVGVHGWNAVALATTNPLPNAAPDAAGGLPISDGGALDIDTLLGRLDAAISTRSSHAAADIWSVATRVLTANTNLNDPTAAAIADAVWDEDIEAAHGTDATAGLLLRVLGAAISNRANNATLNALLGVADSAGVDLPEQVWSETARILTASTNFNDLSAAEVNAECDTAVSDAALATAAALATVDSLVDILNLGIITGSAQTGTLSTTQASTDLTGYADDQLIGRVIIWTSGNCDGEATDITDYANTNGVLTFTALTTAPANGDTFKII